MHVVAGADSSETDRLTELCLFDVNGPCYIRFAREATPIVTTDATPLTFGARQRHSFSRGAAAVHRRV